MRQTARQFVDDRVLPVIRDCYRDARFPGDLIPEMGRLGFFGANEGSIIGVLNGAKETNRKIVIIGYDSGKQQRAAVASGFQAGAITQNPIGIGECVVDSAVKALKGEKLPKIIDTGFYWYDKSNVSDPKVAAVLYN